VIGTKKSSSSQAPALPKPSSSVAPLKRALDKAPEKKKVEEEGNGSECGTKTRTTGSKAGSPQFISDLRPKVHSSIPPNLSRNFSSKVIEIIDFFQHYIHLYLHLYLH
jgi:hypothetical protein